MNQQHISKIAQELSINDHQVQATAELLEADATVPFIARYRKEAHGSLDEVAIMAIRDRLHQLQELDKRREAILESLEERELLTDELKKAIMAAETKTALEDIYLPYRPKRKTRATKAKEKGLEPLAQKIFEQSDFDPLEEAAQYVDEEKGVENVDDALAGARDIIAEWVNEDAAVREKIRALFIKKGTIKSRVMTGKEDVGQKFKDYFDWEEPIASAPSHRILAMRRGEKEMFLLLQLAPPVDNALDILETQFLTGVKAVAEQVREAIADCYKRLLAPSMETEMRVDTKLRAEKDAIAVFADNLRHLLLEAPMGQKSILAIDPGFRTGCKVVCLNSQGALLHNDAIFPHQAEAQRQKAAAQVQDMVERFDIEVIAIGNGTAGRETEQFIRDLDLPGNVTVVMVNESGASVYSASGAARDEFPDYDLTVRGAVSIGRRLMDPLAELVKIDPKSIGVGQYQHDVDQKMLKQSLDDVVILCVNHVGVDVNTASKQLLAYVSGLGDKLAQNIVQYRNDNGPFQARSEFKKVKLLGPKAFEQAAGFLRIKHGTNVLDESAVHPERYALVKSMAKDADCAVKDLIGQKKLRDRVDTKQYITDEVGLPTLQDILAELAKPGRDPRENFEVFQFADGIEKPTDLREGMRLPGIVTNVTKFGAFVDVGVHQDGLVHISQLANRFVKDPADIVKVNQKVMVTVMKLELERNRIALSMKEAKTED
jgi:protein Tex